MPGKDRDQEGLRPVQREQEEQKGEGSISPENHEIGGFRSRFCLLCLISKALICVTSLEWQRIKRVTKQQPSYGQSVLDSY
ncbi:hypothetical protein L1987_14694 [Smallanthus sonchifolius]|uniref:Uncharacterized protein n=1 Tax=Smallanthus sonchifolius TaxID=185202 RepID=A0ACB9J4J9_9ASTR|nr:hypothetical protein L1987_14694 [Smallanthus sonchifolius]